MSKSASKTSREKLLRRLFAPVDIGFLVYFRIFFGAVLAFQVYKLYKDGWIEGVFLGPHFHLKYFGFEWVEAWPGNGMYIHFLVLGILGLCVSIGFLHRVAAFLFGLGFTYLFLLEQAQYQNHFYLICLISFLMAAVPANRALSLDAVLWPRIRSTTTPTWTLWLLRAQVGIPYFFGGIAKLNWDWLHGQPMRLWLHSATDFPVIGRFVDEMWLANLCSYGGLLFDLLVVPLLLWRRTRLFALSLAIAFHLLNSQLFDIGVFPWLMIGATIILFFSDRLPLAFKDRRSPPRSKPQTTPPPAELSWRQKMTVAALAAYMLVQLLVPFRHFLYPGNVNWTEEGHYFSWHMMLRDKKVQPPRLFIYSKKGGVASVRIVRLAPFSPGRRPTGDVLLLPEFQLVHAMYHPDLMLQLCHFVADELRRQGHEDVDIRVELYSSLNGRQPQLMFDQSYNLAEQPRTLGPAPWILPLVEH